MRKVHPACLAAHLQGNFLSGPLDPEPCGANMHQKSAPNLGTKGGKTDQLYCTVCYFTASYVWWTTDLREACTKRRVCCDYCRDATAAARQLQCSAGSQLPPLAGYCGTCRGITAVKSCSRYVVADGNDSSLPMTLIRCCSRNMQCNITTACSIFKHFCVIDL